MNIKTYSKLLTFKTFEERFLYLKLNGSVGKETFGYDRYLNQLLYKSKQWKSVRGKIILRDNGCDLACRDLEIYNNPLVHHINPITVDDIINENPVVFDPENLITTTLNTHNAIHYGNVLLLNTKPIVRFKNDTCLWKK